MDTNQLLASTMSTFVNYSLDIAVLFGVLTVLGVLMWRSGKGRSVSVVISLYVSLFLYSTAQMLPIYISAIQDPLLQIVVYVAILFATFSIVRKYVHGTYSNENWRRFAQVVVLTISSWGLFFAGGYHVWHLPTVYRLTGGFAVPFESIEAFFIWSMGGLIGLWFVSRR